MVQRGNSKTVARIRTSHVGWLQKRGHRWKVQHVGKKVFFLLFKWEGKKHPMPVRVRICARPEPWREYTPPQQLNWRDRGHHLLNRRDTPLPTDTTLLLEGTGEEGTVGESTGGEGTGGEAGTVGKDGESDESGDVSAS